MYLSNRPITLFSAFLSIIFISITFSQPITIKNVYNWPIWINVDNHSHFKFLIGGISSQFIINISEENSSIKESLTYNINSISDSKLLELTWNKAGEILVEDTIRNDESNFVFDHFIFVLKKKSDEKVNHEEVGIVSLSRSKSSLMNQMYNHKLITKRIISFESWKVQIGGWSNKNNEEIYYTPMIENGHQWATVLEGIIIGKMANFTHGQKNVIEIDKEGKKNLFFKSEVPLIFETNEDTFLLLPYSFFPFFYQYFFKQNYHGCNVNENDDILTFECNLQARQKLDAIYLILKGVAIEINSIFFFSHEQFGQMQTFFITFTKQLNKAILHKKLVLHCNVVFDEDNNSIGFPQHLPSYLLETTEKIEVKDDNNNNKSQIVFNSKQLLSYMIIFIDMIGIAGVIYLLIIKIKVLKPIDK